MTGNNELGSYGGGITRTCWRPRYKCYWYLVSSGWVEQKQNMLQVRGWFTSIEMIVFSRDEHGGL
jgi:hypothetical protein